MEGKPLLAPRSWLHLPRRTVRLRLTALYGMLFLASGAALLALTYGLLANQRVGATFNVLRGPDGALTAISARAPTRTELLKFAQCMDAHGANVAVSVDKGGANIQVSQRTTTTPAFRAASQTCVQDLGVQVAPLPFQALAYSYAAGAGNKQAAGPLPPGVVQRGVIASLSAVVDRDRFLLEGGIALGLMAFVSIGLGWVMAGRALRPLRTMTASARQISEDNLHERLAVGGPADEMRDLGETINGLLARLERAFESQRRFVANASHELRTPLAMMRTSLDVALGKPQPREEVKVLATKLEEGLDQADRLLDGLLVLARAQRGAIGDISEVPLEGLVGDALGAHRTEILRLGLSVQNDSVPAEVMGNETLLARMVFNLVDNAIRHNVRGGLVHVFNDGDGHMARLVVANSGALIEQSRISELGEPFRRLGTERVANGNGAGLGLSIVRAIAEAHGGSLRFEARPEGGLITIVKLPQAPL